MSTFLEVCQTVARECRIPGVTPTDTIGQKTELLKIINYVRDAHTDICSTWRNWDFMWREHTMILSANVNNIAASSTTLPTTITGASALKNWEIESFYATDAADPTQVLKLHCIDYRRMQDIRRTGFADSGQMLNFSVYPTGQFFFNPPPLTTQRIQGSYYKKPIRLTEKDDQLDIPWEHDRVVVARAKIFYGNAEDAPDISGAGAIEYEHEMQKLESAYLAGQEHRYTSEQEDPDQHFVRVM